MQTGDRFQVNTPGVFLNLREGPSISDAVKGKLLHDTIVEIVDPNPRDKWFNVKAVIDGVEQVGWAHSDFLKPAGEQKPPQDFEPIHVDTGVRKGVPSWAVGMNLPYLAFYGTPGAPNGITDAVRDEQLKLLADLGVKVVRLFVRHRAAPDFIDRVSRAVSALDAHGMQAILCLIDVFSAMGFVLPELDEPGRSFYTMGTDAGFKLHREFYSNAAAVQVYLDYVSGAATALAKHNNILIWELGNELTLHAPHVTVTRADGDAFIRFAQRTANIIHSRTDHLVGTGLVNSNHVTPSDGSTSRLDYAKRLYAVVDAVSLHYYREDDEEGKIGDDLAAAGGKPVYIGEVGADFKMGGRGGYFADQFRKARFERGCFLAMPWDMGAPSSAGFGGERGLAWSHPDIQDVLNQVRDAAKF